jgi:hypothetical protein
MKNLYKALADFQQEVPVIFKGTQGYGYSYADLPAIFEIINPLLKKYGLGFYQAVNEKQIKTVVFHIKSGECLESNTDIPQGVQLKSMNDFQVLGSAITYIRRYALSSLLGLVTDKDTDAGGEQKEQPTYKAVNPQATAEHPTGDIPICSACGQFKKYVPAGVSKATGKPYQGFYICPSKCRE